jgi:hypothetical protein
VAALLVATGLSFLYVESLKLEPSPIRGTRVTKLFSPVCNCGATKARISFRLGKPDVVAVSIIDSSGKTVRDLAVSRPMRKAPEAFFWNGRDNAGAIVPDGFYQPRVRLNLLEKTFDLPNTIRVDTTPPRVVAVSVKPRVFSPDRDGRGERITVHYRLDQEGQAMLFVDGIRRVLARPNLVSGDLRWYGQVGGSSLPPRAYTLTVAAVDRAGNRSKLVPAGTVRVRYVDLDKPSYRVHAGGRFVVHVSADARHVGWRLAGRHGTGKAPVLVLAAPATPGPYTLYVTVGNHAARAGVRVVP